MRPRLLDLCCGAGGAAKGYHRAGWDVEGVDIEPQPHYPFEFHQRDALETLTDSRFMARFSAVHASFPCQFYSGMSNCRPGLAEQYPDLIAPGRELLEASGLPWVIENVEGSPLATGTDFFGAHGVTLCGRMFGLKLYRHRVFEANFPLTAPGHPRHDVPASKAGHWRPGTIISVSGNCSPIAVAREAMGIDWMNRAELAESIPPAYTQHIGEQLMQHLRAAA